MPLKAMHPQCIFCELPLHTPLHSLIVTSSTWGLSGGTAAESSVATLSRELISISRARLRTPKEHAPCSRATGPWMKKPDDKVAPVVSMLVSVIVVGNFRVRTTSSEFVLLHKSTSTIRTRCQMNACNTCWTPTHVAHLAVLLGRTTEIQSSLQETRTAHSADQPRAAQSNS